MGPRRKPSNPIPDDADMAATITVLPPKADAPVASNLPSIVRFPLYLILSFSLSALSRSIFYELNGPILELISNDGDPQWRLLATTLWKALELSIGWFSGFDSYDMFAFSFLTHIPYTLLLRSFYLVPDTTLFILLLTTCSSNALPLHLLRRKRVHNLSTSQTNERLTSDLTIQVLTSLLATLSYAIPLLLSYATWLPQHLAVYFPGLRTLAPAHAATLPTIAPVLLPLGYAAFRYAFEPAAHALSAAEATVYSVPHFDPATASLSQTLHRNILWHMYLPARTQEVLLRTGILTAWTLANTAFWAWVEVDGCEGVGALGWGFVWAVGAGASGMSLGWVAGVLS